MNEGQALSEGESIAEELMQKLGIEKENLISRAYMDLILENKKKQNGGSQ